jgi:hypothetical protein
VCLCVCVFVCVSMCVECVCLPEGGPAGVEDRGDAVELGVDLGRREGEGGQASTKVMETSVGGQQQQKVMMSRRHTDLGCA